MPRLTPTQLAPVATAVRTGDGDQTSADGHFDQALREATPEHAPSPEPDHEAASPAPSAPPPAADAAPAPDPGHADADKTRKPHASHKHTADGNAAGQPPPWLGMLETLTGAGGKHLPAGGENMPTTTANATSGRSARTGKARTQIPAGLLPGGAAAAGKTAAQAGGTRLSAPAIFTPLTAATATGADAVPTPASRGAAQGKNAAELSALAHSHGLPATPGDSTRLAPQHATQALLTDPRDTDKAASPDTRSQVSDLAALGMLAPSHHAMPAATPSAAPATLQMTQSPGTPAFQQELGEHVAWLGGQDIKQAQIQLNPRHLGPIHVDVQVTQNHVDVSFAVQHPATVHALQQTLPQLDTLLAQHGLNLGQAQVGQQHAGQQHDGGNHAPPAPWGETAGDTGIEGDTTAVVTTRLRGTGSVDAFA